MILSSSLRIFVTPLEFQISERLIQEWENKNKIYNYTFAHINVYSISRFLNVISDFWISLFTIYVTCHLYSNYLSMSSLMCWLKMIKIATIFAGCFTVIPHPIIVSFCSIKFSWVCAKIASEMIRIANSSTW